jgi:hypothetical protein
MSFGKDIRPVQVEATVMDIAPTILHTLNIPIPHMMDGNVLRNIFDTNSVLYNRLEKIDQEKTNNEEIAEDEQEILTKEEELEIMERLKGLGYM